MNVNDAIVIGAGALGCSIAYHLAERGLRVSVLEKKNIVAGVSGANVGLAWVQSKSPSFYLEFTMASERYYPHFLAKIGEDAEYNHSGGMMFFESERQREETEELMEEQKKTPGFQVEILGSTEARTLIPELSADILGATFSPHDAYLNPFSLVWGIARAAKRLGARFFPNAEVVRIAKESPGQFRLTTKSGQFVGRRVINCAGIMAPAIGQMLNIDIPLKVARGQVLVTEAVAPLIRFATDDFIQTKHGNILIGTIKEFVGYDDAVTWANTKRLAQHARKIIPALAELNIIRTWAAIRPIPPDGFPILGEVPGVRNFYVAVTHSGITLCPIIGKLMAELVTTGTTSFPIDRYNIDRFDRKPVISPLSNGS